jgi:hypothetical protein
MKVMSLDLYILTFLCSAAVIFMYTKHIICKKKCLFYTCTDTDSLSHFAMMFDISHMTSSHAMFSGFFMSLAFY